MRLGTPPVAGTVKTSMLPSYSPVKASVLPSGEKMGWSRAGAGGEPVRHAALAADGPQIAGIGEDDLGAVHGRVVQQVGSRAGGEGGRGGQCAHQEKVGFHTGLRPLSLTSVNGMGSKPGSRRSRQS